MQAAQRSHGGGKSHVILHPRMGDAMVRQHRSLEGFGEPAAMIAAPQRLDQEDVGNSESDDLHAVRLAA